MPPKEYSPQKSSPLESLSISIQPPPVESLFSPNQNSSVWPEDISSNPDLLEQTQSRRSLVTSLESIFLKLTKADTEITNALESELVTSKEITILYSELSDFLDFDSLNGRIILYIPFELIPESGWKSDSEELNQEIDRFTKTYKETWERLLGEHDVRANFVDGDIPEIEISSDPLPKVSKAAHLIPILLKKGIITIDEILNIMKASNDEILRESIADALPVAFDLGFLPNERLVKLLESNDPLIRSIAIIIKSNSERPNQQPKLEIHDKEWLMNTPRLINESIEKIDTKYDDQKELPKSRTYWLRKTEKRAILESYANQISSGLIEGTIKTQDIVEITQNENSLVVRAALAKSIQIYIESLATSDIDKAKEIYSQFKDYLETSSTDIESTQARLASLKVLDAPVTDLSGNFSPEDSLTEEFREITQSIESNSELAKYIYPVVICYGSKVKGYGTKDADIDIAVFVKPNTKIEDREKISSLINENIKHKKVTGKILEFWTEEVDGKLKIKNFLEDMDKSLGDETTPNVLFGGVWCGDDEIIKKLHEDVMAEFLYSKNKTLLGHDAREVWLRELERDALQYRLMHKGYERFHPTQDGIIHTLNSKDIDPKSSFWDSGYRRLATKLFLKKVFLPQLDK